MPALILLVSRAVVTIYVFFFSDDDSEIIEI